MVDVLSELLGRGALSRGLSFAALFIVACGQVVAHDDPPAGAKEIELPYPSEVSGVAAVKDGYLVVGNSSHEHYFAWPAKSPQSPWKAHDTRVCDAEAIDVGMGPEERKVHVVLGEDFRTLYIKGARPITLPQEFSEQCGRGAEGLSVRWSSDAWELAVLWEGGVPGAEHELKDESRRDCRVARKISCSKQREPTDALVALYRLSEDLSTVTPTKTVPLKIRTLLEKTTPDEFFRAADIAWFGDQWLVLLGSTPVSRPSKDSFRHTWIQGFNQDGTMDRDKQIKLENVWGSYRRDKNWEALDTTLDGSKLILGYDTEGPSELVVFQPKF